MGESATRRRITRGDATAVFEAFGNGGRTVLQHSQVAQAAPADEVGSRGSIRPFSGSPWDGAAFCADDWHVILIADIEGGDNSFSRQDAEDIMQGLTISFSLDGNPLETTRTAIRRFLDPRAFGLDAAYYFQQGRIMAPADLSVGQHQLEVDVSDSTGQQTFHDAITFTIDASGTGACTAT
ncbi:hypothetical protein OG394_22525 [Kribbella sp. NBC_01245]|uniref:hypothetical protein n=1 Tax=Kribbella sp. NBC_01245 TaxID=2903578 RepID=UPI002E2D8602|nr:hypothetical protein [Kribbella sp. NBC_01245]